MKQYSWRTHRGLCLQGAVAGSDFQVDCQFVLALFAHAHRAAGQIICRRVASPVQKSSVPTGAGGFAGL